MSVFIILQGHIPNHMPYADPGSWEASEHNTLDRFGICSPTSNTPR